MFQRLLIGGNCSLCVGMFRACATAIVLGVAVVWCGMAAVMAQEPAEHPAGDHVQAAESEHDHAAGADGADGAVHGDEGAHGGEHGSGGLATDLPFWGIVAFIGFVLAIRYLLWDSLVSGMDSREAEEKRLIAEVEALRQQAVEQLTTQRGQMEALDEHVREVFSEAERDAAHTRCEIRAAAQREANATRARAELEIARFQDQTLKELFDKFAERVIQSTEERLRASLDQSQQERLIDSALQEFTSRQKQTV